MNNMALSSCFSTSQLCFSIKQILSLLRMHPALYNWVRFRSSLCSSEKKVDRPIWNTSCSNIAGRICASALESKKTLPFGKHDLCLRTSLTRNAGQRKTSAVHASWLTSSEIANGAFTLGTAAVLPIYTFMVVAPKAKLTKKVVASTAPFAVLGALYAYLLYLSWTPDTIRLMFASKYWLPELPGIAKMFSSEMTLASAWIHLLAVDLFAARHVYHDGLEENIETRHSVSLCLLFCPVGILSHFVTKALTRHRRSDMEQEFNDKIH